MYKPWWMWAAFLGVVFTLLILDLGVFHKKERAMSVKESLWMSSFYMAIAFCFGVWVWQQLGTQSALEYYTGFLVEKSLSLDNIFVISLIFGHFSVPLKYQHRVLFWGVLGAIVLRAIMIGVGAELVTRFSWVLYLFALFLIFTGIKMFFVSEDENDFKENRLLQWMRGHLPITSSFHGRKFFVYQVDALTHKKKIFLTPLFLSLIFVEFADSVFAVDSVPAIFTITKDPYIVLTSNIFAILGLRALYFALAAIVDRFYYLKFALASVLVFIGSKIFIADILGLEKFPAALSLGITFGLLAVGVVYSLYKSEETKS